MQECRSLEYRRLYPVENFLGDRVMAVSTGYKRYPKKGEYFISGAIPMAYKAPNNLSQEYLIGQVVKVKKVVRYKIIGEE